MAVSSAQYTVTTTPTQIYLGDGATTVHLHTASGSLYLGDSSVTTANGFLVDSGDKMVFDTHETSMYAVAPTGSTTAYVLVVSK